MGVDWMDLMFRLERHFPAALPGDDFREHVREQFAQGGSFTAGELYEFVARKLTEVGQTLPRGAWNRIRIELATVAGMSPHAIRRKSRLVEDLGFY